MFGLRAGLYQCCACKWFGRTVSVTVNPIMNFIDTLCKCKIFIYVHENINIKQEKCCVKSCKFISIHVKQRKCKKYIYMVLHSYVKQCKCKIKIFI